ncbi:MAG TPA: hypothetical protein DDW94_05415 [Deltaproteobacteria bacterium]|nr:MAG: hypothetical protein A2Z79_04530 [Deltaproteobacteria bacterium GWA2_55_82]OGQ64188.1 MAG: hypothetical protein A3I81_10915 [Deltaproteobacteria bacterium RIFCSPLOWO2_02_FULL_55_12]OIJ74642.1 MAG: hypothetical protein A2V21_310440 [Deltaproteobacteria bacterium GWC2_55_46]HBG46412.1 hypothetical protein [Deltaproteobacteria bacterium]HCY10624.1 hypothetical protein [Deltaproteobacteria bacterium]
MRLEKIFDNPQRLQTLKWVLYAAMAVFIVLDFVIPRHHVEFFWDEVPGFSAAFGFAAFVVVVVVAKALGRLFLQKDEDYYEK